MTDETNTQGGQALESFDFNSAPDGPVRNGSAGGNNLDSFDFKTDIPESADEGEESTEAGQEEAEPQVQNEGEHTDEAPEGSEGTEEQETQEPWWKKVQMKYGDKTYTPQSEQEALTYLNKGFGADQKFQEIAKREKQLEQALRQATQDPAQLLRQLGYSQDEIAQWHERELAKQIEEASLSPEERQRKQEQTELERLRQERQKWQEQQRRAKENQARQQAAQQLEGIAMEALQELDMKSDNPQDNLSNMHEAMKYVHGWMAKQMRNGQQPQLTKDVIKQSLQRVQNNREKSLQNYLKKVSSNPEQLEKYLGKEGKEAFRKHLLNQAKKGGRTGQNWGSSPRKEQKSSRQREFINTSDFDKMMRDMKGN